MPLDWHNPHSFTLDRPAWVCIMDRTGSEVRSVYPYQPQRLTIRLYDLRQDVWVSWQDWPAPDAPPYYVPTGSVLVRAADWDRDGTVNSLDFFRFVADYLAESDVARGVDFNGDSRHDSRDFFDYVDSFLSP